MTASTLDTAGRRSAQRVGEVLRQDLATMCAGLFAAVTIAVAGLAFVGFPVSNWWTDELFTLFLVDHQGGYGEVLNRALTDTHPPVYYFLLYAWKSLLGVSETALRTLSALLAVATVAVFARACRGVYSPPAIAFAAAIGVTGPFWFFQAQNARNYPLCMLLCALMLAGGLRLRRETQAGRTPWATASGMALSGALAAFSHFYALLATGFVFGWLVLTVNNWRLRGFLAAAGLAILGACMAYMAALRAHTQQNMAEMWFRNDADHLFGVIREVIRSGVASNVQYGVLLLLLIAVLAPLVRPHQTALAREPFAAGPDTAILRWTTVFGAVVVAGLYLTGVAVSLLFAPSLSDQNVLVASPFLWLLWAALFDRAWSLANPHARPWIAALLVSLLAAQVVVHVYGRLVPRNEQWRASADYIAGLPACADVRIPVVRPFKFGPDTPFFRDLTRTTFFGRFLPQNPLIVRSPSAFMTPGADPGFAALLANRAADPAACPVLAWAVHDLDIADAERMRRALQRLPGIDPAYVQLKTFAHYRRDGLHWKPRPSGFIFLALRPGDAP